MKQLPVGFPLKLSAHLRAPVTSPEWGAETPAWAHFCLAVTEKFITSARGSLVRAQSADNISTYSIRSMRSLGEVAQENREVSPDDTIFVKEILSHLGDGQEYMISASSVSVPLSYQGNTKRVSGISPKILSHESMKVHGKDSLIATELQLQRDGEGQLLKNAFEQFLFLIDKKTAIVEFRVYSFETEMIIRKMVESLIKSRGLLRTLFLKSRNLGLDAQSPIFLQQVGAPQNVLTALMIELDEVAYQKAVP